MTQQMLCRHVTASVKRIHHSTTIPIIYTSFIQCRYKSKNPADAPPPKLKMDKTTEEYHEILQWWKKMKSSHLDLTQIDPELRQQFLDSRKIYKEKQLERLKSFEHTLDVAQHRKEAAMAALPPRLAFAARVGRPPSYEELLKATKLSDPNASEEDKLFPPMYDPGDIRTQPPYVRSLFDYQWQEGMDAPVRKQASTIDPSASQFEGDIADRQVFGQDLAGLKITEILNAGDEDTQAALKHHQQLQAGKMSKKQRAMMKEQKKDEQRKKKAPADHKEMQSRKEEKKKLRSDIRDWAIKVIQKGYGKDTSEDDDEDRPATSGERDAALQKIREMELLDADLPMLEELLVDRTLNKEFFEKQMPVLMDHFELLDEDRQTDVKNLVRSFGTVQEHIGYGVK